MGLIFKKGVNVQEMITSGDTRDIFTQAINTYLYNMADEAGYDNAYEEVFEFFDTDKKTEVFPKGPKFAIYFSAVAEGEPPRFGSVSDGADVNVNVVHRRAGLRYANDWFRYNQIPLIEKATQAFRDEAQRTLCRIYYGIIKSAATTGSAATGATPVAIGDKMEEHVVAMISPSTDANGNLDFTNVVYPKLVMCNPADESTVKAALDVNLRREQSKYDTDIKPLGSSTVNLNPLVTPWADQGTLLLIEPKRYFVGLKDGELELDTEQDKLFDAENMYGSLRRGGACLSNLAVRYVTIP